MDLSITTEYNMKIIILANIYDSTEQWQLRTVKFNNLIGLNCIFYQK